jgi:hypothetical protein
MSSVIASGLVLIKGKFLQPHLKRKNQDVVTHPMAPQCRTAELSRLLNPQAPKPDIILQQSESSTSLPPAQVARKSHNGFSS